MFTLEDGEVVRAADHAAAIVEGRGKTEYVGASKIVSVRVPLHLFTELQALAHLSGKTKNATFVTLLEVGIEEVKERLSDDTIKNLDEIKAEQFPEIYNEVA
jgi:predicted DNA-binding protein